MKTCLSLSGLSVRYGAIEAVKGIDIQVPEGSIVALLGSNGAGKTSTLRTISGLTPAAGGTIEFYGKNITNMDTEKITAMGVIHVPEGRQIFGTLTVEENLKIGAYTVKDKHVTQSSFNRCYNYFPRLLERKKQLSYTLSGGELQMLAIARGLMANPKILLLDEPSLGLAPLIIKDIFNIISDIKKEGSTVLIVEQNASQTLKIADYAYVLEVGQIGIQGTAQELLADERLIDAYLGGRT